MVFVSLTAKENKEAGVICFNFKSILIHVLEGQEKIKIYSLVVICFDLRVPWKIAKNHYATVPWKFDESNVRHTVTDSWSLYRIHVNWYWHIYAVLASLAYFCNSFACSSKPWTCFCSAAKFYVSMSAVINHVSVSQTKTKAQSIWFPSRELVWYFDRTTLYIWLLSVLEESCLIFVTDSEYRESSAYTVFWDFGKTTV